MQLNPLSKSSRLKNDPPCPQIIFISALILPLDCFSSPVLDNFLLSLLPPPNFSALSALLQKKKKKKPRLIPGTQIHLPHFLLEAGDSGPIEKESTGCLTPVLNLSGDFSTAGGGRRDPLQPEAVFSSSCLLDLLRPELGTPLSQDTRPSRILITLNYVLATSCTASHRGEGAHVQIEL